jgi:hypothetical protein
MLVGPIIRATGWSGLFQASPYFQDGFVAIGTCAGNKPKHASVNEALRLREPF